MRVITVSGQFKHKSNTTKYPPGFAEPGFELLPVCKLALERDRRKVTSYGFKAEELTPVRI